VGDAQFRLLRRSGHSRSETRAHRRKLVGHLEKSRLFKRNKHNHGAHLANDCCETQNRIEDDFQLTKQYGKTYGSFDGTNPNLVTSDAELVRLVLVKDSEHFINRRVRRILVSVPLLPRANDDHATDNRHSQWPVSMLVKWSRFPATKNGRASANASLRHSRREKSKRFASRPRIDSWDEELCLNAFSFFFQ